MTSEDNVELTWQLLLNAYASGYFPMAETHDSEEIFWFYPEKRGIIPLNAFHIPASLAKLCRKKPFTITTDKAFSDVIRACAEIGASRKETWINDRIIALYCELHENGYAHSVECWQGGALVGGLYGVAIHGAFFGESMFSRVPNASRVALVHLVALLSTAGYALLDTQFVNDHLKQFGVVEIPRRKYLAMLKQALTVTPEACFTASN